MSKGRILVVDDDAGFLEAIRDFLSLEGFQVDTANSGEKALEIVSSSVYDTLITDLKLPGFSGTEVLKRTREIDPELPVIVITGFASLDTAIEAVRAGAYDYLSKPFDLQKLLHVIERAVRERKLKRENKELLGNLMEVKQKLESNLNHIFALGQVSKVITNLVDLETILEAIINIFSEVTAAKKVAFLLLDQASQELLVESFKGFAQGEVESLRIKLGEGVIGYCAETRKPIWRELLISEKIVLAKKEREILGDGEFLLFPINYRETLFGILILTQFALEHKVSREEMRVLSILSYQASIAINNSLLYQKLQDRYLSTLEVLVSALEAKCKNTKGHSQRVGMYAKEFAQFLGLLEDELMILERACSVHDIGKIVIPEAILGKPDVLTSEEMQQMRVHPLKGIDILMPLGIRKEIIPIVRSHHERYDGRGYPDALKNGEIPFTAKLVSIVDAYDAMTSPRSYRKRNLSQEEALKEIELNLGSQFDPELGAKFLEFASQNLSSLKL